MNYRFRPQANMQVRQGPAELRMGKRPGYSALNIIDVGAFSPNNLSSRIF